MILSDMLGGMGGNWLVILAVLFVGVLYWAFRAKRPRARDDDDRQTPLDGL